VPEAEERNPDEAAEPVTPEDVTETEEDAATAIPVPSFSDSGEASPMREMVEYVARALASNPDAVRVIEEDDGNRTVYRLSVDEKDKGKIIGRDGRVAQSIRALLRVAATKAGTRVTLEID
jgi:predicted RNA-binding protein YlqC (UPF0109 family)